MALPWILCLKSQIPSTKFQINLKLQYSMTKTFQDETVFGISNFGHCKLFDICDLLFVIFELPRKQIPSGDKTKPGPLGQESLFFLVLQAQVSTAHLPAFHDLIGWALCNLFSVIKDQKTV